MVCIRMIMNVGVKLITYSPVVPILVLANQGMKFLVIAENMISISAYLAHTVPD